LTPAQQAQRAEAKRQHATARQNVCKHCGGTYSKAKHKAICVTFRLDRVKP
jgi:hypothetical protein